MAPLPPLARTTSPSETVEVAFNLVYRICQVEQEPAVQKACREAGIDVLTAARSLAKAVFEIRAAWSRSGVAALRR